MLPVPFAVLLVGSSASVLVVKVVLKGMLSGMVVEKFGMVERVVVVMVSGTVLVHYIFSTSGSSCPKNLLLVCRRTPRISVVFVLLVLPFCLVLLVRPDL